MESRMGMLSEPMVPLSRANKTIGGNKAFHNFANDYTHIQDVNLRRRLALSEIDKIPFGLYHVRAVLVAGVGFFLDSYDIFAINLITTLLGVVFWSGTPEQAMNGFGGNDGRLPTPVSQALKASTSAGMVIGQLFFGWLADLFGRRRMYGIELCVIVLSTMNLALASPSQSMSSTGLLVFWRVMMGVGIGGDYPLSSVITSEFAPTRWRGGMMAAVFSMQGFGQLLSSIVALIVTVAFKDAFLSAPNNSSCDYACQMAADRSWRIIVGVGAIPACFALYYRITIPETPRYTFDVAQDVEKADADIRAYMASKSEGVVDPVQQARTMAVAGPSLNIPTASWSDNFDYFRRWKNLRVLIGTTLSWFFLDFAFYGLGLNNSIVLGAIGFASGPTLYHVLYNNALGMIILSCAGSIPGYWTAVFTVDTIGRRPLQIFGFLICTIIFCILGFASDRLDDATMLPLYVIAQFFFNWGPNTTTFIVPGECFPTRYRSTGHGLSAAMGKIGAIVAQVISIPLLEKPSPPDCQGSACAPGLNRLTQIFALFMLCGTLVSFLIPETKGMTLEELAGEPPTSYNAGRNGSILAPSDPSRSARSAWWNPFAGGQPAGFMYPRMSAGGGRAGVGGWLARSPRVGIMTSPELAAENASGSGNGNRGNSRQRRNRASSTESIDYAFGSGSADDRFPATPASVLPGWGAGWGRIDRGGNLTMDNIRLQDVGELLK